MGFIKEVKLAEGEPFVFRVDCASHPLNQIKYDCDFINPINLSGWTNKSSNGMNPDYALEMHKRLTSCKSICIAKLITTAIPKFLREG